LEFLRHTYATNLAKTGIAAQYLQYLLGHASLMTTQLYLHAGKVVQSAIVNVRMMQDKIRKQRSEIRKEDPEKEF
jgi:site-specific recombinase XerD